MVSIVTKNIHGKEYLYLVASVREGTKVIQKTVKYIGKKRPVTEHEFNCMKLSYKDEDWILDQCKDTLSYQDHEEMKKRSYGYKDYMKGLDPVSQEKERERFLSIFIANSNAIEGSTLTNEETFNYLFKDITPKSHTKKELFMASNLLDAWRYLEMNHKILPTHKEIIGLHRLVNKGIESDETLLSYKKVQNYIGDVYTTSPLFVEEKMEKLLTWMQKAFKEIDDFEAAFQLHAQFEIIHPFVDGNGRVGRLLLNWLLIHKGYMPLAIPVKKRADYISALNNARRGKIEALCRFCCRTYLEQYRFM